MVHESTNIDHRISFNSLGTTPITYVEENFSRGVFCRSNLLYNVNKYESSRCILLNDVTLLRRD